MKKKIKLLSKNIWLLFIAPEPGWLSIDPPEEIYLKPLKDSIFFTCTARGSDPFPTNLEWIGPQGVRIKAADASGADR